jgi:hypothetical protein
VQNLLKVVVMEEILEDLQQRDVVEKHFNNKTDQDLKTKTCLEQLGF